MAPRNVSFNSDGWSRASESADLLYSASVMRSADFKPFSVKTKYAPYQGIVISLKRTTLKGNADLHGQAASLVGLVYGEQPEIPVYSALKSHLRNDRK